MFAFLRKQKLSPEPAKNPQPFPMGYSPDEFRANSGMANMASTFRRSALGGHIFAALHNGVPYGYPERGKEMNPTTAAIELGRVQGYMDCLQLFHMLCTPQQIPVDIPQDYQGAEILKAEGLDFKDAV